MGELVFHGPMFRHYTLCKTVLGGVGGFEVMLRVGKGGNIKACLNNAANNRQIEFDIGEIKRVGGEHLLVLSCDSECNIAR